MSRQGRPGQYPAELRERAVRLVREGEAAYGSEWEAICPVAEMLVPTAETVRKWVRRAEVDAGERPGLKTEERERLKQLERENFELRRANEILRSASLFLATALDGRRRT
jgi:transposase